MADTSRWVWVATRDESGEIMEYDSVEDDSTGYTRGRVRAPEGEGVKWLAEVCLSAAPTGPRKTVYSGDDHDEALLSVERYWENSN